MSPFLLPSSCFPAGTPILAQDCAKPIELFRKNDLLWAVPEDDPDAAPVLKRVLQVFVRVAPLFRMQIGGQLLRPTGEHEFYAFGRGWTPAMELKPGELICCNDNRWLQVDSIEQSKEVTTVYNVEVADCHTYFVGAPDEWGFAVWVHNSACVNIVQDEEGTTLNIKNKFDADSPESGQLRRYTAAWNDEIDNAGGSMTRRTLSPAQQAAADDWRSDMRDQYPSRFDGKVVGHVPDAAAGGDVAPDRAMALLPSANSYLGGLLNGIPVGTTYNRVQLFR
jgi:hypothetical protein